MGTNLSEAYTDTHLQLQHIIPLDFDSVHDLPESHVWTQTDQTHVVEPPSVPVIDLRAPNVVELVGSACRKWGIFQVINHEVPASLVEDVEAHARRLFGLPAELKLKALRSPRGATGYGMARISPFFPKFMWHEGFTIMGSTVERAKLLWPQQYQEFCDAMDNYQKEMKSLAHKILLIMLEALGLDEDEHNQETRFSASEGALQLNSYPSCPNPNHAIGLAPHTDTRLLTILHQNDVNGLQVFQEGIGWISVSPVPEALVVNIGDLMHILSNALFPTVCHRVVPNETRQHRYSIAYFYGPPTDSVVAPLSKVSTPQFRAVTVREYISIKSKHLDKALHLIRIN